MADALGVESIFISDGTVPSRRATVDASGNVHTILASNSGVDIGDVDILSLPAGNLDQQAMAASLSVVPASNITDATYIGDIKFGESLPAGSDTIGDVTISGDALTALQLIDDAIYVDDTATHATGTSKLIGIGAVATPTDGSVSANDIGMLAMSLDRRLLVEANLGATDNAVLDTIVTNTTDIPNVIGTDGAAGPSKAVSVAGTESGGELQELRVDADGHLQVDILSGAGTSTPTNPAIDITNISTPVNIAGNLGTGNLDSADLATKKLRQVCVYGARAFRVVVSTLANGVATPVAIGGGGIDSPFVWEPPHEDFAVSGSSAGADGFRAAVVNLDPVDATDFYASFAYND